MKLFLYLLLLISIVSCNQHKDDIFQVTENNIESLATNQEKSPLYPIRYVQKNLNKLPTEIPVPTQEFDSAEVIIINDSSYYYKHFKSGKLVNSNWDTLHLPKKVDTIEYNHNCFDQSIHASNIIFPTFNDNERLLIVKINQQLHPVIERKNSCCSIWYPMGHEHHGSISYSSLEYGLIASIMMSDKQRQEFKVRSNTDKEIISKLVETCLSTSFPALHE